MPKHLFLCRHAHAQDAHNQQKDFDRELSPAGIVEASAAGLFIKSFGLQPDYLLCSPAQRTRQTTALIAREINLEPNKIFTDKALYNAPATILLKLITALSPAFDVVVLVGHNPSVSEVVTKLLNNYRRQMPTGGVCYISFDEENWSGFNWVEHKVKLSF